MSRDAVPAADYPRRIAGILLASGLLLLPIALSFLIISGGFSAYTDRIQGSFESSASYEDPFRASTLIFSISWLLVLLGFSILAQILKEKGEIWISTTAFTAGLFATVTAFLHATFALSVDPWAVHAAAETGAVPEIYEVWDNWVSSGFGIGYILHLGATAGFAWSLFRTHLLNRGVCLTAIGLSLFFLAGRLLGVGAPAIPVLLPAFLGVALFRTAQKS